MRILFVGNGLLDTDSYPFPNQGGSVQTWGLSRELAERGHEVFIVRRYVSKGELRFEKVNLVGIRFAGIENLTQAHFMSLPFHLTRMFSSFQFSIKSLRAITSIRPDVVCLVDRISGVFPARLGLPKLYILHVPEALDFFKPYAINANGLNAIMFYVKKVFERSVMSRTEKIVVLNSYIENYLSRIGLSNVVRIPNAVDPEHFADADDENFILYAGRFDWNKNVSSLLKAFAELHNYHGEYRLCLVGEGPEKRKMEEFLEEKHLHPSVVIRPWMVRRKLLNIMRRCSVFVLPSSFEAANPVVILEAMASSKPVIAKTNMGTKDIIIHGKNGYLFNDQEELRDYLELLLSDNDLRKKIGRNARKIVEEKYSFARIADKYEETFSTLLHGSPN